MPTAPLFIEPDPDTAGCARVYVEVQLGDRPYRMSLDTGTVTTQVVSDRHTAAYRRVRSAIGHGVFGAAREVEVVQLPSVTVATQTVGPLEVHRVAPYDTDATGLLGLDVLGSFVSRLDLRHAVLELLTPGDALPVPARHPLQRSRRGHVFVQVQWPNVRARACLDTGADITLVDEAFATVHPELLTAQGRSTGTDSVDARRTTPTVRIAACRIGAAQFSSQVAAVTRLPQHDGPMDLLLGYPTLSQAQWLLDLPDGRFAVRPYA